MARRKTASSPRSPCPIAAVMDLMGDRWTLLVVRDLFTGPKRYGDLARAPECIPTNLLADRLGRLEEAGLVRGKLYQTNPPRNEYELTPKGETLRPLLQEIVNWGRRHLPGTKVRAELTGNAADSPFLPSWIKLTVRQRDRTMP